MKNRLNVAFAIVFAFAATVVSAQEKRNLNLHDAIQLSIQNSHQLKTSQAKIDEATAALQEAVEQRLPEAKVSGSYLWLNSPNIDMKTKLSGNSGGGSSTEMPKVNQAIYGMANLSLPIYTGGKIKYGIESSRYLAEATKLDADYQREEVIQNTIAAYINLFKSRAAVDLVKESLAQSQQRVKEFSSLEKNGLLARNDLLKAELQASNKELALLDAQNNWQLANINMNLLLGLPEHTELILDSLILEQSREVKPLDDYIQSAITNRKDFASIDLQKKAAQTGVKATKGNLYPSVALTGGYFAADIPNMLSITNAVNAGVGVSYNLSSLWKNKSKVQQAEARVRQVTEMQALKSDQLRQQVNKSYLDWLSTQKKLEVYEKAIVQANENYRITKNKYDNSLATTTDLLDADVAQLQARVDYVFAKADAIVIYNELLKSAGILNEDAK